MNKFEYLISLLPKAGIDQKTIEEKVQIYLTAGEYGELVSEAAAILNKQETVPEEVEQALRDADEAVDEDASEWYTWRYPK